MAASDRSPQTPVPRLCRAPLIPGAARRDVHPTQRRAAARLAGCRRVCPGPVRRAQARPAPRMRPRSRAVPIPPTRRRYLFAAFAGALTVAVLIAWMRRRADS